MNKQTEQVVMVPVAISADEMAAFHRFCDTCEDSEAGGYDVPKKAMMRLAAIGLIRHCGFGIYESTAFGDAVREAMNEEQK